MSLCMVAYWPYLMYAMSLGCGSDAVSDVQYASWFVSGLSAILTVSCP